MIAQLRSGICLMIICLVTAAAAAAQSLSVASFTDTLEASFTDVTSVSLNVSDGRMLIADSKDRIVRILSEDWSTDDTLAARGEGPGEFVSPVFAFWSDGDSVWIGDVHNRRLTLISLDDGRRGGGRASTMPNWLIPAWVRWVDPEGGAVVGLISDWNSPHEVPLGWWTRSLNRLDTVALINRPKSVSRTIVVGNSRHVVNVPQPFSPADAWGVHSDGRVIVMRAHPFRAEWIEDGSVVRGPEIEYSSVRVSRADRAELTERAPSDVDFEWPLIKPAMASDRVVIDQQDAWVSLSVPSGDPEAYARISYPEGRIQQTLQMPPGVSLVAAGDRYFYGTFKDDLDRVWLLRTARDPYDTH